MNGNTDSTAGIAHEIIALSADVDGVHHIPAEGRFKAVPAGDGRLRFKAVDLDATVLEFTASVGAVDGWLADGVATVENAANARTFDAPEWASA